MLKATIARNRQLLYRVQRLVDYMSNSDQYGEEWAKKAYYLLDDMRSYLAEEEAKSDA